MVCADVDIRIRNVVLYQILTLMPSTVCFDYYLQAVRDWWQNTTIPKWTRNFGGRLEEVWRPRHTKKVFEDEHFIFTENVRYFNFEGRCYEETELYAGARESTVVWGRINFYFRLDTLSGPWNELERAGMQELFGNVAKEIAGKDVPTSAKSGVGATLSALSGVPYLGPALGIAGDSIGKSDLLGNIIKHADKFERLARERLEIKRQVGRKQFHIDIPEDRACWVGDVSVTYFKYTFREEIRCTREISTLPELTYSTTYYRYWIPTGADLDKLKELIETRGETPRDSEGDLIPDTDQSKIDDYKKYHDRIREKRPTGRNEFDY